MAIHNRPLCLLALLLLVGALALPFLSHAPNRLISGQPVPLWTLGSGAWLVLLPGLALLAGPFLPQRRRTVGLLALAALLLLVGLVHAAALGAELLAQDAGRAARTSFGAGFWVMALAAVLALADLVARAGPGPVLRLVIGLAAALPILAMVLSGHLDQLSILKEYANRADQFQAALLRHAVIVLAALLPTLAFGVPLGVLAHRRRRLGASILSGLNLVQTVPSIAIFGLLIAPLSALATLVPAARALGISGIGLAPAVIALTLYSLLPIVRNTAAGLAQVPASAIDAARGMGMTRRQVFWKVEAPLALPVFLSGLRITVVQAIGLAAVAALIGAGGLGAIMFQGLFSNALDLILLGALPIIAFAALADALFKAAVDLSKRGSA
ncbi:osmoprotectant uptake system permease [Cereibacter changlensis JA139]|uniref:Osmoprotectant uptake system permease n=2 Tax=Cereibacter changlensis TaxID=402884 RepID=A0A2T4JPA1_9RHOB|nr:ABC transporter permease [Cereibacter changlensis]PTE19721.1 osmoprotectant uptake system permease [Cereibacter changlensis JA139]PZX49700.1 osmoprotectant transport system permease protein [Cereibacter changlensis]